jgi:hypothetical protein
MSALVRESFAWRTADIASLANDLPETLPRLQPLEYLFEQRSHNTVGSDKMGYRKLLGPTPAASLSRTP